MKTCGSGKVCHRNRFAAYRHMGNLLEKEDGKSHALLTVYRCKECSCWHVGHMPRTKRIGLGLLQIPLSRREEEMNDLATDMFAELSRIRRELPCEIDAQAFLRTVLDYMCKKDPKLLRIRSQVESGLLSRFAALEKKAS